MIAPLIAWWIWTALLGALALPIAYRLFPHLADRGYALSRALGLLASGYLLWLGASVGVLRNDFPGAFGALVVLGAGGLVAGAGRWRDLWAWIRQHRRTVFWTELLFLLAFVGWAAVRAANPEIAATEKPMELAYLNAVLQSPRFPPQDPWLSGYAISYYYFGYVLLALMSRLTAVPAGVAFNLGNALWFALTCLGAWSILLSLLQRRQAGLRHAAALLGPLFVLVAGNLEGILDVLWSGHIGWRARADGELTSRFWTWLDIKDLNAAPVSPPSLMPNRFLWWWRASRVIHDRNLGGADIEVIDEFPFFSFLLADNHPHLLALPFVLLAIAFTLQIFLSARRGELRIRAWAGGLSPKTARRGLYAALGLVLALSVARAAGAYQTSGSAQGALAAAGGVLIIGGILVATGSLLIGTFSGMFPSSLTASELLWAAWFFGALAFLNTWDLPIYLALLYLVLLWKSKSGAWRELLVPPTLTVVTTLLLGLLLYLPWYPTFTSQAGGILPNLFFPSRFVQLLVMFAVPLVPVLVWLVWRASPGWSRRDTWLLLGLAFGLPLGLWLISLLLGGAAVAAQPGLVADALNQLAAGSAQQALQTGIARRLQAGLTPVVIGAALGLAAVLLRRFRRQGEPAGFTAGTPFVLAMAAIGLLLILGPEFVYLKDLFGTRMNTVFKFYYAAWVLLGLSAAFVATELWPRESSWKGALRALALLPLLFGLVYPALATWTKTNGFRPPAGLTLDGTAHLAAERPEDAIAIEWIRAFLPPGVIAEAVGGSYTEFGRIATHTGMPNVLGWEFHELQWRGSMEPQGTRKEDLRRLYQTHETTELVGILQTYGIDYVYIGPLERRTYSLTPPAMAKFEAAMDLVYASDEVMIYAARSGRGF
ncbi:MAG: DUF2298 domain-containing protein [Anaerolineales bacterium]|nr:DUF2298 domain-containing protein [Anaerolineales bacterium]